MRIDGPSSRDRPCLLHDARRTGDALEDSERVEKMAHIGFNLTALYHQ